MKGKRTFYSFYCNECDEELLLPFEYVYFNKNIVCPYCGSVIYNTNDICLMVNK